MSVASGLAQDLRVSRLRATQWRARVGVLRLAGVVVGCLAATVPTGYLDLADGAGLLGGAYSALLGTVVVSPIALGLLMSIHVTGDQESGLLRHVYLAQGRVRPVRVGAVLAALWEYAHFVAAACVAGCMTGLGDALRSDHLWGVGILSFRGLVTAAAVFAYVLMLTWGLCLVFHHGVAVVSTLALSGLAAILLVPSATAVNLTWALTALPLSPVLSLVSPGVLGRFAIDVPTGLAIASAAAWFVVAALVVYLALRRDGLPYPPGRL